MSANMTPEQALQLLDQAAGMAPLNRQAHIQVQQAVQVLQRLVQSQGEEARMSKALEEIQAVRQQQQASA